MNLENLENAWRSESHGRIIISGALLMNEVRRNEERLRLTVLWRDIREVAVALLLIPVFLWGGLKEGQPWTIYLTIPALLWVAGYILVDRVRQKDGRPAPGDPPTQFLDRSLSQLNHQIHLLRNVFWWYLLPLDLAVSIFFLHSALQMYYSDGMPAALVFTALMLGFIWLLSWGVYRLNQYAVRAELEPRRRELVDLRNTLQQES